MKNKISKIYYLLTWVLLFGPGIVSAWSPGQPLVPCGTTGRPECTEFGQVIELVKNLLDFFIWIAVPIATILFAWIGWDLMVAESKSGAISDAKKRLMTLVKGLVLVLGSWLIIRTIVSVLVSPSFYDKLPVILGK